ncbi:hypothetical protein RG836_02810, partial [Pseudomonas sp. SZMC_28357]|uniref:hypothetical protein n=1 Tax=Pseudomonas sp. SZMC_28357 TaxID=3074380 RepID=UPI0028729BC4
PTGRVDQKQKRGELTLDLMGIRNSVDILEHWGSCGATIRLASDDGLTANPSPADVPKSNLWERACSRRLCGWRWGC